MRDANQIYCMRQAGAQRHQTLLAAVLWLTLPTWKHTCCANNYSLAENAAQGSLKSMCLCCIAVEGFYSGQRGVGCEPSFFSKEYHSARKFDFELIAWPEVMTKGVYDQRLNPRHFWRDSMLHRSYRWSVWVVNTVRASHRISVVYKAHSTIITSVFQGRVERYWLNFPLNMLPKFNLRGVLWAIQFSLSGLTGDVHNFAVLYERPGATKSQKFLVLAFLWWISLSILETSYLLPYCNTCIFNNRSSHEKPFL